MGQTLLANQFVTGLRPDLKAKVVETEGNLDQLLVKARFEEAKRNELATTPPPRKLVAGQSVTPSLKSTHKTTSANAGQLKSAPRTKGCFNCGLPGHIARFCSYPEQQKDQEACGRKWLSVACVEPEGTSTLSPKEKVEDLRRKLHEAELAAAVDSTAHVIRSVTQSSDSPVPNIGPMITSRVDVNGISTEALVDTGSPVTIISLDFAMIVMAKERNKFKSVEEWQDATLKKFEPPEELWWWTARYTGTASGMYHSR